ncbi:MAG: glycosyltransferase family 9 protein [Elusimicrobiota bacterium]
MIQPARIKKILVIKICCLGDILFMTPTLAALRDAFPQARIDFLASSWVKDLLMRIVPSVGHIRWDAAFPGKSLLYRSTATISLAAELKRGGYDLALIGHRSWPFAALTYLVGIPIRAGFSSRWGDIFLTHKTAFAAQAHETQRYLRITQDLGINAPATGELKLKPAPGDAQAAQRLLQDHGADIGQRPICILPAGGNNPGTKMPIKHWPHGLYTQLIDRLLARTSHPILLLGDINDKAVASRIVDSVAPLERKRLIDLTGKTDFSGLTGLLSMSRLSIGADSGPLHMSAALAAPTLILFGPSDPRLVAPPNPNCRYLWKQVDCAPCYTPDSVTIATNYKRNEFLCHTGTYACLQTLTVEEVLTAAMDMLDHA